MDTSPTSVPSESTSPPAPDDVSIRRTIADAPAWLFSLVAHMVAILALALINQDLPNRQSTQIVAIDTPAPPPIDEAQLELPKKFDFSDLPTKQPGNDELGAPSSALTLGPVTGSALSGTLSPDPGKATAADESAAVFTQQVGAITLQDTLALASASRIDENVMLRGEAGVGETGAVGAVDRITHEILQSLEQRKTLVVWLFDRSVSMQMQRDEINARLVQIYTELGGIQAQGNPAFAKYDDKPLLSAVIEFGATVNVLTKQPTDDVAQLQSLIAGIQPDASGVENVFSAIDTAVNQYKWFRSKEPRRNVMLVAFSDEIGNDQDKVDRTVTLCRDLEMPVYVVGVPAPFGRRQTLIKYIDPDPKFDQTPQWAPLDQGPESFLPEMVYLHSPGADPEEPIDSGYGPYSLTRLCYETGGIYFAVHPNRDTEKPLTRYETANMSAHLTHFFDPEVMRKYRPDYVSTQQYKRLINESKARAALVTASQLPSLARLETPRLVFPKRDEAALQTLLTTAQQAAAALEPKIVAVYDILKQGEKDRPKLTSLRWQAGYDLAMGRVIAAKVRTESYNMMLAQAKQGLKFANENNDTWELVPSDAVTVGSMTEKQAQQARLYLTRVVTDHPGTPWALLAKEELDRKMGWEWKERFTNANPPQVAMQPANNNPPPAQPRRPAVERPLVLPKPPPKRPPPAL